MDYFIEIRIKPDDEMRENILLNKLYTKLHKALVALGSDAIGVSFPQYKILLGKILRIHGDNHSLAELSALDWLGGLIGYCQVEEIQKAPENSQYRTVSRVQTSMSQSKLKRLKNRHQINDDEVKSYKEKMFSKGLDNPYLELESGSNGHKYRRYLEFGEIQSKPVAGTFDSFGLSKIATVPWF